jgi:hypothetical protein
LGFNFVGDRLYLPRVSAATDDEEIGEGGNFPKIQNRYVFGLF